MSQFEGTRRGKLPARYSSIMMPFILSIMMTFIVSLIATAKNLGFAHPELALSWTTSWALSWLVAFPVLLAILPVVRKMVSFVCHPR
jgi:hypothetical protein